MASGHILHNWPFWQILHLTNPLANSFVLGLGVHLDFQGPFAPLATTRALGPTPLIMGVLGNLDPLRSVGSNPRPTVRTSWSMGPSGPSFPKFNEAKRGQGGLPPSSKAKWAHLNQFWPPIPPVPQMAKRTPGPKSAKNHVLATFNS
ncbi:hypothetical protein O181_009806 [Austropuccinia psidii MF-1]|uniref:Uncharacterized protein n=1 Tax=Austropuccinia psidii MF-1 TaxID=1389203 RepID=A0A9Q3BSJ4_9BASI|nr:hypothetical protein [Austropuccinia psidii MF-1]